MLEKPPPFQKAEEVTHAGADHELSPHSELAKQAIDFFEADVQRILTEIEAGEAHFFGSTDRVTVRCFMLVNPEKADDVPIFLTRPSIALSATEFKDNTGRMYNLGEYIDNTIHSEIWYYWEQLIREDPSSERAAFFQKLLISGAKYKRIEGMSQVLLRQNKEPEFRLENGYLLLQKFPLEDMKRKIAQLGLYGFTEVNRGASSTERVSVEKYILEYMLSDTIEASAQKLA